MGKTCEQLQSIQSGGDESRSRACHAAHGRVSCAVHLVSSWPRVLHTRKLLGGALCRIIGHRLEWPEECVGSRSGTVDVPEARAG
eukprot:4237259-Prymnesium_polylepis.1